MTDGEIPRLIYLVLLAIFVGGFLLAPGRGRRMAQVKHLLAWLGIFAALIIAYGQRHVLMSELFPATPRQLDGGTIAVSRSPGGSFETTLQINGVPVRFLVDTGATDMVLSLSDAARVGFDPDRLRFDGVAITANGTVQTASVRLDMVEFAGHLDRDVPASVNAGALSLSLLGMSYLDQFDRIEISGDRMLLIRR